MSFSRQLVYRAVILTWAISPASAWASDGPTAPSHAKSVAERLHSEISRRVEALGDWDDEAEFINASMDRLWERNDWTSEPDRFARRLTQEITSIPPSQFAERMEKLTGMVAQRYGLTPAQRSRFQANLYREAFGFFASNAGVIGKHAGEYISTRAGGERITSEQVARWTRESEAAMNDGMLRCARFVEQITADATAEQRRLIEQDFQSFRKRMALIEKQREAWARGEWSPEDWGMEAADADDESETASPAGAVPADATNAVRNVARAVAEDESSWRKYVRLFIASHRLDAGQREAAYSILTELEDRADQYRRNHVDELGTVPLDRRATDTAYEPIRAMFDEIKSRLNALLTETQRSAGR